MKKFKFLNTLLLLILSTFQLSGQNMLTIDEAMKIALQKNYDVRIAKNDTQISDIENGLLNSGYLPRVTANGGINYSDENQNVTFSDGNSTSVDNAVTESYNASITAEYTIFDGFERKLSNQKNTENLTLKKLQERQLIENTIITVYQEYYNIAYQKQVVDNLKLNIENSFDRLDRAKKKLKYGQGTKLDELNSQVDLNNDSISYASAKKDFNNSKRNFNLLLGRNVTNTFVIDTTVFFLKALVQKDILEQAQSNNIVSLLNKQNVLLSDLDIKVNTAKYLPKINGSAGYSWFESINPPTNFALQNESYGINLGLSLSWNIFDGGKSSTKIQTSKIAKENREIDLYRAQEELKLDVYNAFEDYTNKRFSLRAEKKNVFTNQVNFSRTKKQFSLGQVNTVEFRQAQINLLNALNNYAKAKYDLKISEISLLQLGGILLE